MAFELTAARQAMMKSTVSYEAVASDPTAVWRIATAANHKTDMVQHQRGDFQKVMAGIRESLNRMEIMLQKIVNSQRRTTEPALGRSTPEGNFKYPYTGLSVVVTGWSDDPLQQAFSVSPTLNNMNPSHGPEMVKDMEKGVSVVAEKHAQNASVGQIMNLTTVARGVSEKVVSEQGERSNHPITISYPFTYNLPKEITPADLYWSIDDKQAFIEEVVLNTLNWQVRHFTGFGNTPMVYPLKPVIEEIQKSGEVVRVWDPGRSKIMRWQSSPLGVGGGLTIGGVSAAGRAQTLPKSHHCFSMRLKLEYSKFSSLDSDEPFARKFNIPKHSHYVILSKIVCMGDQANGAVEFGGVRLGQVRNLLGKITYDPKSCAWMSVVNVINLDKRRKHNVTENYLLLLKKFKIKDGLTVAKSIDSQDRVKNVGASLVKQVANATNDTAGDGTTCATVLTKAIFTEGCKSAAAVMDAMDLRRGISMAVDAVVINLKSMARTINISKGIAQVGSISANGKVVQRLTRVFREKVSAGPLKLKEIDCNDCIVPLANKCIHQEILFDSAALQ